MAGGRPGCVGGSEGRGAKWRHGRVHPCHPSLARAPVGTTTTKESVTREREVRLPAVTPGEPAVSESPYALPVTHAGTHSVISSFCVRRPLSLILCGSSSPQPGGRSPNRPVGAAAHTAGGVDVLLACLPACLRFFCLTPVACFYFLVVVVVVVAVCWWWLASAGGAASLGGVALGADDARTFHATTPGRHARLLRSARRTPTGKSTSRRLPGRSTRGAR